MWYKLTVLATVLGVQVVYPIRMFSLYVYHIQTVNCILFCLNYSEHASFVQNIVLQFLLYSAVHPMKFLDSDVMWCKYILPLYENTDTV